MHITQFLPKSYLSWGLGALARLPLPWPLSEITVRIFARAYGIDLTAATQPVSHFSSIGDFFVRDVRSELRPIGEGVVSPVDGTLRSVEVIEKDATALQVKGMRFSLTEFLGDASLAELFVGGSCYNFYLSPTDAHHIHSPVDGAVVTTRHIPGKLWPVNSWAIENVPNLFATNERIVSLVQTAVGRVAVVMVGATNVGRIQLQYVDLTTNTRPWRRIPTRSIVHDPPLAVRRGDKIGTFHMGSSVVLLLERSFGQPDPSVLAIAGRKVQFGVSLDGAPTQEALFPG
jgi:phosphatidylserine decarboxylase